MTEKGKSNSRRALLALLLLVPVLVLVVKTRGQEGVNIRDTGAQEQWEYMVLASASGTNFSPSGNPRLRKESGGAFGREAFVLEQQMDKLGSKGWELVTIAGTPNDPVYYFKRRK
jgi:hypothetical protein